jgi:thiamine biosynthesis protein ThiI
MYRVASAFADEKGALGIVTGESLGQVASQTIHNLHVLDNVVELPVYRPLIGMDKVEIENIARKIGTYGVSARKVNGCTVVPDKPATRSSIVDVANLEEELELPGLCSEAFESIERRL